MSGAVADVYAPVALQAECAADGKARCAGRLRSHDDVFWSAKI